MFRFDKVSPFLTSGFAFDFFFSRLVFGFLFLPLCGAEYRGQFMSFIFRIFSQNDGEINEMGDETFRDTCWGRNASN